MDTTILPDVVITGVKIPATCTVAPNPMHAFASWTYTWTLWWLDINDYNELTSIGSIEEANNWNPTVGLSYVVAEDSGLYPDRRLPGVPYDYIIDSVEFETLLTPNTRTKSSNLIEGSMVIQEPYGISLIDVLVKAGYVLNPGEPQNYLQRPYMLECNFVGYDDNNNPVPSSKTAIYRKRFPIRLLSIDIDAGTKGTEYKVQYCAAGHIAHFDELGKIPVDISVTAGTVNEFFTEFAKKLNYYWSQLSAYGNSTGGIVLQYPDSYKFVLDPGIGTGNIVDQTQLSLQDADLTGITMDFTKQTFKISRGTPIVNIIEGIMAHSDYFINLQGVGSATTNSTSNQTTIFNIFKTQVKTQYTTASGGTTASGSAAVFDTYRNCYPQAVTYYIHQYPTWDGKDPNMPLFMDPTDFKVKQYDYLYTGHNVDVIDFKLAFNTTFYTAVMAYNTLISAVTPTKSTSTDFIEQNINIPLLGIGTIGGLIPAVAAAQSSNLTPLRYRILNNVPSWSTGYNKETRPAAITAAQVINSTYTDSKGDMITLELRIVGDPTLIKQDDWYYGPDPTAKGDYNSWNSMSQSDFANKYGHYRTDTGEVYVQVNVNTIYDIDADVPGANQGFMFPNPSLAQASLFSGLYKIATIKNEFSNGKLEQVLNLYRNMNQDINDAVARYQTSQREGSPTQVSPATNINNSAAKVAGDSAATSQSNQTSVNNSTPRP